MTLKGYIKSESVNYSEGDIKLTVLVDAEIMEAKTIQAVMKKAFYKGIDFKKHEDWEKEWNEYGIKSHYKLRDIILAIFHYNLDVESNKMTITGQ